MCLCVSVCVCACLCVCLCLVKSQKHISWHCTEHKSFLGGCCEPAVVAASVVRLSLTGAMNSLSSEPAVNTVTMCVCVSVWVPMSVLSKAKIRPSPMPCAVYPWSPTLADFPAVFFIFVTLIFVMKHKYKLSLTAAMSSLSTEPQNLNLVFAWEPVVSTS